MANGEEVAIMTSVPDAPYKVIGPIEARVSPAGPGLFSAFGRARTVEDVNSKLREEALKVGANAVIEVSYERGMSAASNTFKLLTARGTATVLHSTERTCPFCAESIKRDAIVCRFCGRDVPPTSDEDAVSHDLEIVRIDYPAAYEEARTCLDALPTPPVNPVGWLRELCKRIEAGSPPGSAAERIPLDWR